jgi:hypothetical protein
MSRPLISLSEVLFSRFCRLKFVVKYINLSINGYSRTNETALFAYPLFVDK